MATQDVFFWRLAGRSAPTGLAIVHWIGCINAIKQRIHIPSVVCMGQNERIHIPSVVYMGQNERIHIPSVVYMGHNQRIHIPSVVCMGQNERIHIPSVVYMGHNERIHIPSVVYMGHNKRIHIPHFFTHCKPDQLTLSIPKHLPRIHQFLLYFLSYF